jgi:uncharacterized membrane protein YidH (DUF202 family)
MGQGLSLTVTLIVLATSLAGAGALVWHERRPVTPGRVRLLPTTPLLFLALIVAVVMIVHLLTLMGADTTGGRRPF